MEKKNIDVIKSPIHLLVRNKRKKKRRNSSLSRRKSNPSTVPTETKQPSPEKKEKNIFNEMESSVLDLDAVCGILDEENEESNEEQKFGDNESFYEDVPSLENSNIIHKKNVKEMEEPEESSKSELKAKKRKRDVYEKSSKKTSIPDSTEIEEPKPKKRKIDQEKEHEIQKPKEEADDGDDEVEELNFLDLVKEQQEEGDDEDDDLFDELEKKNLKLQEEEEKEQKEIENEMKEMISDSLQAEDFLIFKTPQDIQKEEEISKEEEDEDEEEEFGSNDFPLPGGEEEEQERLPGEEEEYEHSMIQIQIQKLLKLFSNKALFKEVSKLEEKKRGDYVQHFKQLLMKYYGYSESLLNEFYKMFSIFELVDYLESNEVPRPITIRCNSLKISSTNLRKLLLQERGIRTGLIDGKWSEDCLKILPSATKLPPLGATPEYLTGYYMLQSASSQLCVLALSPQPNDVVLDMCSAPGGKTTHMSALMKNTGVIYANDLSKPRLRGVVSNVHRLGCRNMITLNYDSRDLCRILPQHCDKVLLDAPCSGTGVISKDLSIKGRNVEDEIRNRNVMMQKELILCGFDCLKVGGIMVYSTCSVLPYENEEVVTYLLKKRHAKILPIGDSEKREFPGKEGKKSFCGKLFHPTCQLAKRIFPHVHNMDGFFICKIQKVRAEVKFSFKGEEKKLQKKKKLEKKLRERKKEENLNLQEQNRKKNKKLFEQILIETEGDVVLAKQILEKRRKEVVEKRGKFKRKNSKNSRRWRKTH